MKGMNSTALSDLGLGEGDWTPGAMKKVKRLLAHHIDFLLSPDEKSEARTHKVRHAHLRQLSADELTSCRTVIASLEHLVDRPVSIS